MSDERKRFFLEAALYPLTKTMSREKIHETLKAKFGKTKFSELSNAELETFIEQHETLPLFEEKK